MTDSSDGGSTDWRELTAVLLLSVTAILTAWSGFQSSKWGGAMSISFSQASSARIEAARLNGDANRRISVQVGLFTQWLDAESSGSDELADFLAQRFPDPLAPAFDAWLLTNPLTDVDAPSTPFEMPQYVIPENEASVEADARADAKFAEALANNQRGDNYTILTVLFATVLFFAAMSARIGSPRAQWTLLGLAMVGFVVATVILISFPKLI